VLTIVPKHRQIKTVGYTQDQMFDLVLDVQSYPEFLPWCLSSCVTNIEDTSFEAELLIGFKLLKERFGSCVRFERPYSIQVTPTYGPFRRMHNVWSFETNDHDSCRIIFCVDFEFKSIFLNKVMGVLFYEAVQKMVNCFEARARKKYGPPLEVSIPTELD
tara:strand:+ start:88 stop:567 length:480 start_codon:yes stop_codon:yes gene_type:complete